MHVDETKSKIPHLSLSVHLELVIFLKEKFLETVSYFFNRKKLLTRPASW